MPIDVDWLENAIIVFVFAFVFVILVRFLIYND